MNNYPTVLNTAKCSSSVHFPARHFLDFYFTFFPPAMIPSLVVLTDFYAVTNRTLSYAAGLAVPLGAQLVLLHVRHDPLLGPTTYHRADIPRDQRQTRQALLDLAAKQPVATTVDVAAGFLPEAVTEAVRVHHPLFLVLARPGQDAETAEFVTSTAVDVLRNAPYPLLVVPAVGWDASPPRRLLLAVDGEPFRLRPHQDLLRRLLYATEGTLDVVHVTDDEHAQPDAAAVRQAVDANDLVDQLPASRQHEVYNPSVLAGMLQEADRLKADLLVVVARHHGALGGLFHQSQTARLIQESPIPVLILPAED